MTVQLTDAPPNTPTKPKPETPPGTVPTPQQPPPQPTRRRKPAPSPAKPGKCPFRNEFGTAVHIAGLAELAAPKV